jgi:hypothetical protein
MVCLKMVKNKAQARFMFKVEPTVLLAILLTISLRLRLICLYINLSRRKKKRTRSKIPKLRNLILRLFPRKVLLWKKTRRKKERSKSFMRWVKKITLSSLSFMSYTKVHHMKTLILLQSKRILRKLNPKVKVKQPLMKLRYLRSE